MDAERRIVWIRLIGDGQIAMIRYVTFLALILAFGAAELPSQQKAEANVQEAVSFKNFSSFRKLVTGVDFFASGQKLVTPFVEPTSETIAKLQGLLGKDLPKGAVFICSTLEQRDSIYEPKVLRAGYGWTMSVDTPEVRMQEMMDRMKSQMGGEIPEEFLSRMNNMPPEMMAEAEKQMVDTVNQQMVHAVLWAFFAPKSQFRSSRLDDVAKSPLPDWLDMGIAAYASGKNIDLSFLLENLDQTFSLEDIFLMSRPFVASSVNQGSSGGSFRGGGGGMPGGMSGGMPGGMSGGRGGGMPSFGGGGSGGPGGSTGGPPSGFGSRGSGGFGGSTGQRGGMQRVLPKDEQDRMLFDLQSGTFFQYLLEKVGVEKVKTLIKQANEGGELWESVTQPDMLGSDLERIEEDWISWVQARDPQKSQNTEQAQSKIN